LWRIAPPSYHGAIRPSAYCALRKGIPMNTAGMMPHERLPFRGIDERPPLHFPKGVRTVVWPVLALEVWDISRPMARMIIPPPQGQPMLPDHPNWSWHEYGMRVGFWRIRRLFDKLSVRPTVTLNARCCEIYPSVVKACLDSGWELNAHSYDQQPMHKLADQRETIFRSLDLIEKFRNAAARLVRPGTNAGFHHARSPARSRRRIFRRLGVR
jgi:hypothetical protein